MLSIRAWLWLLMFDLYNPNSIFLRSGERADFKKFRFPPPIGEPDLVTSRLTQIFHSKCARWSQPELPAERMKRALIEDVHDLLSSGYVLSSSWHPGKLVESNTHTSS